ncbi:MAG TPA: hypothetical protein VMV81_13725 [Phycisphaerae bacterium]|nr:hypothetical protein [Phycisphaerae bacterium]
MALRVSRRALPAYSTKFSRHDFTQRQLFAILALKQFFRTDYRGIVEILADMTVVRRLLKLTKLPHYTTLQKAHDRLLKKGLLTGSSPLFSALQSDAA